MEAKHKPQEKASGMLKKCLQPDGSLDSRGTGASAFIVWRLGEKSLDIEGEITVKELIDILIHIAQKEGIDLYRL